MFHYVGTLVLILLIWGLLKYLRWKWEVYDNLEKIGGPKTYPFIGTLWLFFGAKRSDFFQIFRQLDAKYGPFFRSYNGFKGQINITRAEHFEQIISSSMDVKKGILYKFLKELVGDGLLVNEGAKWHQKRKMITPTFHFKILENFMTVFVEKSKILVDYLEEKADGNSFDVYPYITHCTLDVISETAMGVSINAMSDRNSSYTRAIYTTAELVLKRQLSILQQTPLYPFLKDGKEFYKHLDIMYSFTDKVIADRRKTLKEIPVKKDEDELSMSPKKRLSLLDLLLDASSTLTDTEIREEVNTFMFGGHDTTTAGICWSLFMFSQNQDIQEKTYQEVKSVLGDKRTPETISELHELKYLEYCIKETLRMFPSVPVIGRQLTDDIIMDGHKIPKGTNVILDIYALHRDPEVYPDPDKYDPDRFLSENCKNRHPYAYLPFSAGARNCIGQKFAMYEEKTLLASILRSYKILPVDTLETITIVSEITLKTQGGLKIALEKRID